jgi:hypothetical protein
VEFSDTASRVRRRGEIYYSRCSAVSPYPSMSGWIWFDITLSVVYPCHRLTQSTSMADLANKHYKIFSEARRNDA